MKSQKGLEGRLNRSRLGSQPKNEKQKDLPIRKTEVEHLDGNSGYRQTLLGPATSLLPQATYNEKAGACHLSQRSVPRINARRSEGPDEAFERKLQVQAPCLRIQLVRSDFPSSVLRSQPRL